MLTDGIRIVGTSVSGCSASTAGGAISTFTTFVQLASRTRIFDNSAPLGRNVRVSGGMVWYELPAPDGAFIEAGRCVVSREPCERPRGELREDPELNRQYYRRSDFKSPTIPNPIYTKSHIYQIPNPIYPKSHISQIQTFSLPRQVR